MSILSKIIVWALGTTKITGEDKALITTALLKNIDALPIRDAITFDENGMAKAAKDAMGKGWAK